VINRIFGQKSEKKKGWSAHGGTGPSQPEIRYQIALTKNKKRKKRGCKGPKVEMVSIVGGRAGQKKKT